MAGEFDQPRAFRVNQRFTQSDASSMIGHYLVMRNPLATGAKVICGTDWRTGRMNRAGEIPSICDSCFGEALHLPQSRVDCWRKSFDDDARLTMVDQKLDPVDPWD